ncbi:MAG: UvrB/UvrC motif-containing protein [Clostridia bacterium]|nr:UvrB/UvrC motif-containing protein [Clostridia bacterium]
MLCQNCKKNTATIFYEETVNGKTSSYALCHECAAKMRAEGKLKDTPDLSDTIGSLFGNPFGDLFGNFMGIPEASTGVQKTVCPDCGCDLNAISQTGMAGCPTCYTFFMESLQPMIRNIHGNTRHTGRIPLRFKARKEKKDQLAQLKKELNEAIKHEEFEKAAELRDQIRSMENENRSESA